MAGNNLTTEKQSIMSPRHCGVLIVVRVQSRSRHDAETQFWTSVDSSKKALMCQFPEDYGWAREVYFYTFGVFGGG